MVGAAVLLELSTSPPILTYNLAPTLPKLTLPANACDCHVHVFGPPEQFAYSPTRNFTPVGAPKEALFALHRAMGITRCVIVQSAIHGMDNSAVQDAITAGGGNYLGVALAAVSVNDAELARLADAGFRAVRFNFMKHLAQNASIGEIITLTHRLAHFGLHLQVHFESSLVHELGSHFKQSAVPVVIDHIGRVDASLGLEHGDFQALCRLVANDNIYIKVSGIDRIDPKAPYREGIVLARHLVASFADRCLWGTDWPHPNHTHVPDDGVLVDALAQIAPTAPLLQRLLVDNPQKLYQFKETL